MNSQIEALRKMTRAELLAHAKSLAAEERRITAALIECISVIEERKFHLEAGYGSLFDFVQKELGFSEGAAGRRIAAARLLRKAPEVKEMLASGALSLTNAAKVNSHLYREFQHTSVQPGKQETRSVLGQISGRSTREAEGILAERSSAPPPARTEWVRAISLEQTQVQVVLTRGQMEKLERVKKLLSHTDANLPLARLIEVVADFYLQRKDPMLKAERALAKCHVKIERCRNATSAPESHCETGEEDGAKRRSRTAPKAESRRKPLSQRTVNLVWRRAQGHCEFEDPRTRRRCDSRHRLEVDHMHPVALGGGNDPANLQLLCQNHHGLKTQVQMSWVFDRHPQCE